MRALVEVPRTDAVSAEEPIATLPGYGHCIPRNIAVFCRLAILLYAIQYARHTTRAARAAAPASFSHQMLREIFVEVSHQIAYCVFHFGRLMMMRLAGQ